MDWASIGLILVAGLDLGMALLIWLRNPKNKINIFFGLTIFFLAVWSFGCALFKEASSIEVVITSIRILNIGGIIMVIPFFLFSLYFPYETHRLSLISKIFTFLSMIVMIVVLFYPDLWFIRKSIVVMPPNNYFEINFGYWFFSLYFLFYIIFAYYNLLMKYKVSVGFNRVRLYYILIGTGPLAFFGTIVGLVSPFIYNAKYFWVGPYFSIPMLICLIYFAFYYKVK